MRVSVDSTTSCLLPTLVKEKARRNAGRSCTSDSCRVLSLLTLLYKVLCVNAGLTRETRCPTGGASTAARVKRSARGRGSAARCKRVHKTEAVRRATRVNPPIKNHTWVCQERSGLKAVMVGGKHPTIAIVHGTLNDMRAGDAPSWAIPRWRRSTDDGPHGSAVPATDY